MNKIRYYTDKEIEILLKNSNIISIKYKSQIEYSNKFKLKAVIEKLNNPYKSAKQIFIENGFDMNILNDRIPQKRISFWIKKYKKFGTKYFLNDEQYYCTKENNNINNNDYYVEIKNGKFVVSKIEEVRK